MAPLFSVVIPAYNQANFLDKAIESVLRQTHQDFEILVVNDASTDSTVKVIESFTDPRVLRIEHQTNQGLPAARNSGMYAAHGKFIALLDADDFYDPHKLEQHLRFFQSHPDVGATYNARYELHHSSNVIRDIYRPPVEVGLNDFILGFPFSPSDMMVRRETAAHVGFFDENYRCGGEDLDFPIRLALDGCRFLRVEGVLNYRRHHTGRQKRNLSCRLDDYTRALNTLFIDPRCPIEARKIQKAGFANHYTEVAIWALAQGDAEFAQEIFTEILRLDQQGAGSQANITNALLYFSIRDESVDHEQLLTAMLDCLPQAFALSTSEGKRLIGHGYLIKGTRASIWGDDQLAHKNLQRAHGYQAKIDAQFLAQLSAQLSSYQMEFGQKATKNALLRLQEHLGQLEGHRCARALAGQFSIDQAFISFRRRAYRQTLENVVRAVSSDPKYLLNRGVLSITTRSFLASVRRG